MNRIQLTLACFVLMFTNLIASAKSSDITNLVFGGITDGMPAAFGDFDSDELTDVLVLRDEGRSVEILLSGEEEPLLRRARPPLTCNFTTKITSVVPGDFDGDALMDVLVTTVRTIYVYTVTKKNSLFRFVLHVFFKSSICIFYPHTGRNTYKQRRHIKSFSDLCLHPMG